jgi:nitric oxide reductase activation protein
MAGTSVEEAKQVLITLLEALKHQFNVCVYGHTAEDYISDFYDEDGEEESYFDGTSIMEYFSLRNPNYKSIINAEGRCENFDGMAIKQCGKRLLQDYPESRKILFHICDGQPHTSYMSGSKGKKYVNDVSQALRRQGVEVYCIGICNAFSDYEGKEMYGDGNFVVIKDILSSVNILSRFIQQICNKSVATYVQS